MATQYPSNRSPEIQPGISRRPAQRPPQSRAGYGASTGYRSGGSRPAGSRPASAGTRQGAPRYAGNSRPSGAYRQPASRQPAQRAPQARRPQQGYSAGPGRRPAPRRGRGPRRNYTGLVAALAAVLVLVVVLVVVKPFDRGNDVVAANVNGDPGRAGVQSQGDGTLAQDDAFAQDGTVSQAAIDDGSLQQALADSEANVGSLSAADMAQVHDLSINTSLPSEWLNVLLLGTDERELSESARTDSMMICSINQNTGEVKLSSIQRDLAIEYTDIGRYNGTYRINAANFFGGSKLAMKTVNEKFKMNIQYYVMVNFFGFQRIAEQLGGINIDISQEEMEQINVWALDAWKIAQAAGIDVSDVKYKKLKKYGENVHLNGTQTLAYARIRKLDGGDYARSERQRKVLAKLAEKVKDKNALEIASMASTMLGQVKTNMEINDIVNTALLVAGNGISNIKTLRLPVTGTYTEERRNDDAMLWDCDFDANATQLYNFIYEG